MRASSKLLGRIHSADETRRAPKSCTRPAFELQSRPDVRACRDRRRRSQADIDAALALQPAHLSQYHLTIEPGTLFAAAPP
jgi:oxygen-independent coproporphyrinogen-3 oxidase